MEEDKKVLDSKLLDTLKSAKGNKDNGSETDEAISAVNSTGRVMDAIMAGRQLDIAFYSIFANSSIKKIRRLRKKKKKNKK